MRILVTGSSGHLGEALVRVLSEGGDEVLGLDVAGSPFTHVVGSIVDRAVVRRCVAGADAVIHTATLHKPHVDTRPHRTFVDTNVVGTLNLLEEAADAGCRAFVYTSTTSAFGRALTPAPGEPAAWITEDVVPIPRNIYGVTKVAAEDLCELIHRERTMPCVVLRTSRFFPEADDREDLRASFDPLNLKVNELLHRRVDLHDVVNAHRLAVDCAATIGFARFVISATTPFLPSDRAAVRADAPTVVRRLFPDYEEIYADRGWRMNKSIDRVYVNALARRRLGWAPRYDFRHALECIRAGRDPRSDLAVSVGAKGYTGSPAGPAVRFRGGS